MEERRGSGESNELALLVLEMKRESGNGGVRSARAKPWIARMEFVELS